MKPTHLAPYASVLDLIGWTPLVRISRVSAGVVTPIYGKAEFINPGGSVKDRIGLKIIEAAEQDGSLRPGGVVVEGTSGNTGVGLAIAASLKGYRCIFTMPDKMSSEKVRLLKAFGAEVVITPTAVPPDHPDNYVMKAKAITEATPGAVLANQFYNQVNPKAHYETTGPEIWAQTNGKVTHFVAAAGTGGTVSGAGKYLKEQNPSIQVIAGDPVGSIYAGYWKHKTKGEGHPYKVEGVGGDKIPSTLWVDVIDAYHTVSDKDGMQMARRLAREEGLFVGGSAGLNVFLALDVARRVNDPSACVVTILSDTGERYLSKLFNDEWMHENQLLDAEPITVAQTLTRKTNGAPPLVSVAPNATVRQALNLMGTYNVSQLPVLDEDQCVGAVSEQVLMAKALENRTLLENAVRDSMDQPFPEIDATAPLEDLVPRLTRETPAVLVRQGGALVGVITRYDVLQQLSGIR